MGIAPEHVIAAESRDDLVGRIADQHVLSLSADDLRCMVRPTSVAGANRDEPFSDL